MQTLTEIANGVVNVICVYSEFCNDSLDFPCFLAFVDSFFLSVIYVLLSFFFVWLSFLSSSFLSVVFLAFFLSFLPRFCLSGLVFFLLFVFFCVCSLFFLSFFFSFFFSFFHDLLSFFFVFLLSYWFSTITSLLCYLFLPVHLSFLWSVCRPVFLYFVLSFFLSYLSFCYLFIVWVVSSAKCFLPRILETTKSRLDGQPFYKNKRIILDVSVSKSARDLEVSGLDIKFRSFGCRNRALSYYIQSKTKTMENQTDK